MREKYKLEIMNTFYGKKRLALQNGSDSGNLMGIWLPAINSRNLKLNGVNVCWDGGAEIAITAFSNAKESVSADRQFYGKYLKQNQSVDAVTGKSEAAGNFGVNSIIS